MIEWLNFGCWEQKLFHICTLWKGNVKRLLSLSLSLSLSIKLQSFQNWRYVPSQKSLSNFIPPFRYVRWWLWAFVEKLLTYEWPSKGTRKFHGFVCTVCTNRRNRTPESALCYPYVTSITTFSSMLGTTCPAIKFALSSPLWLLVRSVWWLHVAPYLWPLSTKRIGNRDTHFYLINFFFTITKRLRIVSKL